MLDAKGTVNSHGYSEYRVYDERNRLREVVDANNGQTRNGYDLLGRLLSITDAKGQTTTMAYDYQGNVNQVVDPVHESPTDKVVTFLYDQSGNRIIATDRDGRERRSFYDRHNRLARIDHHADGVVGAQDVNEYDNYDTLSATGIWNRNPDGSYSLVSRYLMTYTPRRKLDTLTELHGHSLHYVYDAVGNVTEKTDYQGHVTSFQYDSVNRLVAERNPHFLQVSYYYDGAGRLINRILSNGAQTGYRYDADNRLSGLKNLSANGAEVEDLSYQRDAMGNITQIADGASGRTVTYTYDSLYRLTGVDSTDNSEDRGYSYDKVGNRLTETKNGVTSHYLYSAGNRLTELRTGSVSGPLSRRYSYTDSGRVQEKRGGDNSLIYSLTYDARGRVAGSDTPSSSATYLYDIVDYRINRSENGADTRYLHEGEHVEAVYDGSDTLKWEYFRGVVVDEIVNGYNHHSADTNDWTNYSFHHDHINSVTALTGHAGTVEQTWDYDAFGKPLVTAIPGTGNDLLYTGREYDAKTGLYYYRARYYDPEIGRFISEDPLGFGAGDVNFYAFVGNNPVNGNDPMGLEAKVNVYPRPNNQQGFDYIAFDDLGSKPLAGQFNANTTINVNQLRAGDYTVSPRPHVPEPGLFGTLNDWLHGNFSGRNRNEGIPTISNTTDWNTIRYSEGTIIQGAQIHSGRNGTDQGNSLACLVCTQDNFNNLNALFQKNYDNGGVALSILTQPVDNYMSGNGSNVWSAAGGGFVLYPNKPNTNMMESVYKK